MVLKMTQLILYKKNFPPKVKILELNQNYGFAEGNNIGFNSIDKAEYSIFINNDTIVDPGFVEPLINSLEADKKIMQVSPKIFYNHHKDTIWYAGGKVNFCHLDILNIKVYKKKDSQIFSIQSKTDYATGCCICMRSNDFDEIGGVSIIFFPMYCEDLIYHYGFKRWGGKFIMYLILKYGIKFHSQLEEIFSIKKWKQKGVG
ncbi:MAG: hypothetical protein CM1200mP33_4410 [Chloroflexota bacterium]|nr:MAG: hypothetical protein CM1200mP33_4410 [Chloroflexota bacterium]